MKRILLIQTGGTIGSEVHNGVISTAGGSLSELCGSRDVSLDVRCPFTILSENLSPLHWEKLIETVYSGLSDGYDGIIVTHGSDTLAYTSAVLGLCFGGSAVPVVITAANRVPSDPKSNARVNMTASVDLISKADGGVFTVYRNENSTNAQVWLPTRLISADRFGDNFSSPDGHPLAEIDKEGNIIPLAPDICRSGRLASRGESIDCRGVRFSKRVLLLSSYPGMDYNSVTVSDDVGAVLLVTYHSGTVSENSRELIRRCREKGIPVYLCSVKSRSSDLYETTHTLISEGVTPLYDMTDETALAKLTLALNIPKTDIQHITDC